MRTRTAFTHRQYPNGSWDSICMKCFMTTSKPVLDEEELQVFDEMHTCDEEWLNEVKRAARRP
jgi:hypothetical protein